MTGLLEQSRSECVKRREATLVDLHIHGAFGIDVQTADVGALDALALGLERTGVSGFLPTLVPLPLPELREVTVRLSSWIRSRSGGDGRGALPLGIHFEGPFVSHLRCGALHRACFLDGGDEASVQAFLDATADVPGRRMITMAPEIRGGLDLVRELSSRGFLVSIGHTEADAATLDAAFTRGARHLTHFGNAMRPLHHRDVGPIGWGLLHDEVTLDVIADLRHLAPEMLRLVFKAKRDRVAVISDACAPAGLPDGPYQVWGETLTVKDGTVTNGSGALAGSVCLLDEAVRRLTSIGIDPERALRAASEVPRRILA